MLDDLTGGGLRRGFNFLKDVKNFKDLSKWGKLRTVAVPFAPVLLFGGALTQFDNETRIDALNVMPAQQVMMQACIDAHAARDVNFGDNVSTPVGCACTSKLVSSVTPPAHYAAYGAVQALAIDQYYWQYESKEQVAIDAEFDNRVETEIEALAHTQGLNQKGLRHMFDYVLSADQVCDTPESYQGGSGLSLAALMPLETPIWEGDSDGVVEISLRGAVQPIRVSMTE